MTKSAKQDTKEGPAATAETESAATTDADATGSADATPAAADSASAPPSADDAAEDAGKPDIDDVKAKFREALDRKRQVHAEEPGQGRPRGRQGQRRARTRRQPSQLPPQERLTAPGAAFTRRRVRFYPQEPQGQTGRACPVPFGGGNLNFERVCGGH